MISRVPRYQNDQVVGGFCDYLFKSSHIGEDLDGEKFFKSFLERKEEKKCHRMIRDGIFNSISFKDVSCIDFLDDIIQGCIVAVGDDGIGQFLEFIEVVHNP